MTKFIVVLLEFNLPGSSAGSNLMWFTPISEVGVVGPDDNRDGGASEQVRPIVKGAYDF